MVRLTFIFIFAICSLLKLSGQTVLLKNIAGKYNCKYAKAQATVEVVLKNNYTFKYKIDTHYSGYETDKGTWTITGDTLKLFTFVNKKQISETFHVYIVSKNQICDAFITSKNNEYCACLRKD